MQALDLDFPLLSDWNAEATHGFGVAFEHNGMRDVSRRSAFLVDVDGVVRGAWAYEPSELPDLDELIAAARALVVVRRIAFTRGHGNRHPAAAEPRAAARRLDHRPAIGLAVVAVALVFALQHDCVHLGLVRLLQARARRRRRLLGRRRPDCSPCSALRAERSDDPEEIATHRPPGGVRRREVFAPAGLLVLLMGIAMVINGHWSASGRPGSIIGLVGYAITFLTGIARPLAAGEDASDS